MGHPQSQELFSQALQQRNLPDMPFAPHAFLPGFPAETLFHGYTGLRNPYRVPRLNLPGVPYPGAADLPGALAGGPPLAGGISLGPVDTGGHGGEEGGGDDDGGDRGGDDDRGGRGRDPRDRDSGPDPGGGGGSQADPSPDVGSGQPSAPGISAGPSNTQPDGGGGGDHDAGDPGASGHDPGGNAGDAGGQGPGGLKRGGIVTRPQTVRVGEGGRDEAIVPLQHPRFSPAQALQQILVNERRTKGANNPRRGGLPPFGGRNGR